MDAGDDETPKQRETITRNRPPSDHEPNHGGKTNAEKLLTSVKRL